MSTVLVEMELGPVFWWAFPFTFPLLSLPLPTLPLPVLYLFPEEALKGFPTKKKLLPASNWGWGNSSQSLLSSRDKNISCREIPGSQGKAEDLWLSAFKPEKLSW